MISTDLLKANGWTAWKGGESLWLRPIRSQQRTLRYDMQYGELSIHAVDFDVWLGVTHDFGVLEMFVAALELME